MQKKKDFDHFVSEKLSKKSLSYQDDVKRTLRRLENYSVSAHGQKRDDIISYLKSVADAEKQEDETLGWIQGFIDNISADGKISYKVLQVYLSHIKKYLKYFRLRVDFGEDIELPSALLEERYAISVDDIREIISNSPWKYKGYFLSLVSSGARPVEIMALRKKDFTWTGKRWKALIPAKYTKKKISRTVFFSFETSPYISKLLQMVEDSDRVWTKDPKLSDEKLTSARQNAGVMFRKQCNKIGFTDRYETTNFYKYNMYCFRSHFFTKALRALSDDKDTAHAMIGHGAYLQQYQRRTDKEKEELFDEIESELLIFDNSKKNREIHKLKEANAKLIDQGEKINELSERLRMIEEQKAKDVSLW